MPQSNATPRKNFNARIRERASHTTLSAMVIRTATMTQMRSTAMEIATGHLRSPVSLAGNAFPRLGGAMAWRSAKTAQTRPIVINEFMESVWLRNNCCGIW